MIDVILFIALMLTGFAVGYIRNPTFKELGRIFREEMEKNR